MAKREVRKSFKREKPEFDQKMVDLARVTRVTGGGKQLSFRALVVIGDHKNRVGFGVGKGKDVTIAVTKAVDEAKKRLITVRMNKNGTIAHEIRHKFKAAYVMLKPAPTGTGVKAGGSVRIVLDMAGIQNVVGKMLGNSANKINNVTATWQALQALPTPRVKKEKEDKKDNKKEEVKEEKK